MSKIFIVSIAVVVLFFGAVLFSKATQPKEPTIGTQMADQGRKHIGRGEAHEPYNSDLPVSGPHYADSSSPTNWGIHDEELPSEVLIHNMEHGGVVVTYRPDLPADQIKKLKELFNSPYSNNKFKPIKAIVIPRAENKSPIVMGAWRYVMNLQQYNEK